MKIMLSNATEREKHLARAFVLLYQNHLWLMLQLTAAGEPHAAPHEEGH